MCVFFWFCLLLIVVCCFFVVVVRCALCVDSSCSQFVVWSCGMLLFVCWCSLGVCCNVRCCVLLFVGRCCMLSLIVFVVICRVLFVVAFRR